MTVDATGEPVHDKLDDSWRIVPENSDFRGQVLQTQPREDGTVQNRWVARRPLPESDIWFETAWAAFREGRIYEPDKA